MKLAEALALRADCLKRLDQVTGRLKGNVLVQEGDQPSEDPAALLEELNRLADQSESLILRINLTNTRVSLKDGTSMTAALAKRDLLKKRFDIYKGLADVASVRQVRQTRTEIKFVSVVEVAALRKTADDLAKQFRELDSQIQETNWLADLEE